MHDDPQPAAEPAVAGDSPDTAAPTGAGDVATSDTSTTSGAAPRPRRRRTPLWLESVVLLAVALGMALIIKTFFVQAFYIPSESMEPGLVRDDRILVQKVSYWFGGEPQRGDVVVFQDPGGWLTGPETGPTTLLSKGLAKIGLYPPGGHLVKRVIGLPGDTITCCDEQGRLMINGVAIDESEFVRREYGCDGPMPNNCTEDWSVTVPEDRLFVMGDNRAHSADSSDRLFNGRGKRVKGDGPFVPIDLVVGKVFALVWPLDHAETIGRPDVFEDVPDPS